MRKQLLALIGVLACAPCHAEPGDRSVPKTFNDAFFQTTLAAELIELAPERVIVAGWATDMCVDATIRSAAALGFRGVAARDATTVSDREHLPAEQIIEHCHWVWTHIISEHPVSILDEAAI